MGVNFVVIPTHRVIVRMLFCEMGIVDWEFAQDGKMVRQVTN